MEPRKITVIKQAGQGKVVIVSSAETLAQLKADLHENSLTTELEYVPISDKTIIAFYQVEETIIGKHIIYAEILFRNS